ncbi:MAG: hypothetical protein J6D34_00555 [Atopobiaceae bacterium]|nr:hypothetical protein [Atopobiaceae bacterium]
MNNTNSNQPDFRSRLIAFLVILAVGFVMGYVNGRGQDSTKASEAPIVQEQQEDQQAERSEQTTSQQAVEDDQDFSLVDQYEEDDSSDYYEYDEQDDSGVTTVAPERGPTIEEDGWYTTKDEVALYIHTYGRLPGNYISKTKARDRGWVASKGNLDEVCPGMSIGGSRFYNDDGMLPDKKGRNWTECDINYHGGHRGAERIVFSNDGLVFYTGDHYRTFEQLY